MFSIYKVLCVSTAPNVSKQMVGCYFLLKMFFLLTVTKCLLKRKLSDGWAFLCALIYRTDKDSLWKRLTD